MSIMNVSRTAYHGFLRSDGANAFNLYLIYPFLSILFSIFSGGGMNIS